MPPARRLTLIETGGYSVGSSNDKGVPMAWWQWIVLILLIGAIGVWIYLRKQQGGGRQSGTGGLVR